MRVEFGLSHQGKNTLRIFKNRVLRRVRRGEGEKVTGGCGELRIKELRSFLLFTK
jgi:hypothetical protein